MSGRRPGAFITVALGLGSALAVAACGSSGEGPHTAGPTRDYPVSVSASFPASQRLAQQSQLVIAVRNTGTKTLPNVAVTLTNPHNGTAASGLGRLLPRPGQGQPLLASRSRPIWIITRNPGPCVYSCTNGGPGGAATAYANTWALGRLAPGQVARFAWYVTAVQAGRFNVNWTVAAGLDGKERAVTGRRPARGTLGVSVSSSVPDVHVSPSGAVSYTAPGGG